MVLPKPSGQDAESKYADNRPGFSPATEPGPDTASRMTQMASGQHPIPPIGDEKGDSVLSLSGGDRTSEKDVDGLQEPHCEVRRGDLNRKDIENGSSAEDQTRQSDEAESENHRDPNLVSWDGPNDPNNPKLWSMKRKWSAVMVGEFSSVMSRTTSHSRHVIYSDMIYSKHLPVSMFTLISPLSSSILAPAIPAISAELSITSSFEGALVLSIFVLAYAIGPLVLGPLSELYGRVIVLQLSNLIYLFFNLGCGLARTSAQIIAFRFLSGLGGSAPLAIGGGVLGDLFTAEQRGRAMSIYSLMPLLGPAVGPVIGGFVAQRTTWRWIFYATTLADAVIQAAGLFLLQETYAPVLLARKRDRLVRETGNAALRTEYEAQAKRQPTVVSTLATALTRPFRLLATQVIVQVLALYMMYLYGLLYLQLTTFPKLWTVVYGESVAIGGLNYVALGIGLWLGSQLCAPLQDRIYAALKRRYNVDKGRPEFRVPMMLPGAFCVPVGLLIYGWCAEYKTHWIGPDIGVAILALGVVSSDCPVLSFARSSPK